MKVSKVLSIIAIIISLIAIAFTLIRITPFEVTNDVYIGIVASFIGISVTLVIGFQIVNTLEIRKEVAEQKAISIETQRLNSELSQIIKTQRSEMQEGFDIINTLIKYQEQGWTYSIQSFSSLHHALLSSLQINRTEYEWIFRLLRSYIADINWQNFTGAFSQRSDSRFICCEIDSPFYEKDLKDIIKEYTDIVKADEDIIRKDVNFCSIKMEYDRVMKLYNNRISEMLKDPTKNLTDEQKDLIINQ